MTRPHRAHVGPFAQAALAGAMVALALGAAWLTLALTLALRLLLGGH